MAVKIGGEIILKFTAQCQVHTGLVRSIARECRFVVRSRKMDPFILFCALVDVLSSDNRKSE